MCVCVWGPGSGCGHGRRQLFGVCARSWGAPKPPAPFACVCIFMQGFEVVLLNASFGCIGELFLNLAWQGSRLGFASTYRWVSIDVWGRGLLKLGFYIRRLFDRATPALGCQPGNAPPPSPRCASPEEGTHGGLLIWQKRDTVVHLEFLLASCCLEENMKHPPPSLLLPALRVPNSCPPPLPPPPYIPPPFPGPPRLSTWLLTL